MDSPQEIKLRLAKIEAIDKLHQLVKSDQYQSAIYAMKITNFSKKEILGLIEEFTFNA